MSAWTNRDLIYCRNGTAQAQEVTFEFGSSQGAEASQPLPFSRAVPAHTELFLLSVRMDAGRSTYQSRFSYRALP